MLWYPPVVSLCLCLLSLLCGSHDIVLEMGYYSGCGYRALGEHSCHVLSNEEVEKMNGGKLGEKLI